MRRSVAWGLPYRRYYAGLATARRTEVAQFSDTCRCGQLSISSAGVLDTASQSPTVGFWIPLATFYPGRICIVLSMFAEQTPIADWDERRRALRDKLIVLGDRRRKLRAEQAKVSTELRRLLPEAVAVHWRVSDLARWAGMTRKAVYDILARERVPSGEETP